MNEIIKSLQERKSCRQFTGETPPPEWKDLLIEAAIQAPTAGNQMFYTILDIEKKETKEKLAILCDNQPFINTAPIVFVFLADYRRWYDSFKYAGAQPRKPGEGDFLLACCDAIIAAHNTVVAAESLGLRSCYIGDVMENCEEMRKLLHLDPYTFPAAMVVYGYPTEIQKRRVKPGRFPKEAIVQKEKYHRRSEEELRDMFKKAHPEPQFHFDTFVSAVCKGKYMSAFSLEMTRSVAEYLKDFKSDL